MFRLDVGEVQSVVKVMRSLLPLSVKKHEDLRIALDYFEGRITGSQALDGFGEQVSLGRRRGNKRIADLPYTRAQGLRLYQLANAERARIAHRVKVPIDVKRRIKRDRKRGMGIASLRRKYGYTHGVLERVIREPSEGTD